MIKVTNRAKGREGDVLYIAKHWIVAVYEDHVEGGSLTTVIFGGPHNTTWLVEESIFEVLKLIEKVK